MQTRGFYRAAAAEPSRTALVLPDGGSDSVAALPRDPNGTLYEHGLPDPCWEGRERRI